MLLLSTACVVDVEAVNIYLSCGYHTVFTMTALNIYILLFYEVMYVVPTVGESQEKSGNLEVPWSKS